MRSAPLVAVILAAFTVAGAAAFVASIAIALIAFAALAVLIAKLCWVVLHHTSSSVAAS